MKLARFLSETQRKVRYTRSGRSEKVIYILLCQVRESMCVVAGGCCDW